MKKKSIFIEEIETDKGYRGRYLQIDGVNYPIYEAKIIDVLISSCYMRS